MGRQSYGRRHAIIGSQWTRSKLFCQKAELKKEKEKTIAVCLMWAAVGIYRKGCSKERPGGWWSSYLGWQFGYIVPCIACHGLVCCKVFLKRERKELQANPKLSWYAWWSVQGWLTRTCLQLTWKCTKRGSDRWTEHGKLESYVIEQCHEILIWEWDGGHTNVCCKSNFLYIRIFCNEMWWKE